MKLKILFYGFRHGHVDALYRRVSASSFAEVAGCIEPDADARAAAEERLGACFSEQSYDAWLATDVDAIAIGCAYGDRGEAVIKALAAGKHVIADKPICTTRAQWERIRSLSEETGAQIACMLDLRYLPQTKKAKELLSDGTLGEVKNVSFNGQHCLGYGTRPSWYFEKGMHGGTINDLAIHGVDLVRMLTGMEFFAVDAARTWNSYAKEEPQFCDSALLMARLENGAGVLADVSYSAPSQVFSMPTYWEFRFWCEKGLLTFSYTDACVHVYREGNPTPEVYEAPAVEEDYLDEFWAALQSGARDVTENVLRSTKTALWLQEAADREA